MADLIYTHGSWCDIPLLIAGDDEGIRALLLGDEVRVFAELQVRFPMATCKPGHLGVFESALDHLNDFTASPPPLAPSGTAFQQAVWSALRTIPFGQTATYGKLANQLGRPRAARALAAACAANPIAILIPCHRVIRSDGSLSGYRWGVETKAKLLESER